ncbi:MAG: rRNA maturation RNase YbeY [Isosphaeraceae bacterium]
MKSQIPLPPAPDVDATRAVVVEVSDTQSHLKTDRHALDQLVRFVLRAEGVERAAISLAIVDDATIRTLNRRHLEHDWPTDVISFLYTEPDDLALSGELVISAETALAVSTAAGVSPFGELALYVVHGLLHLLGHDDTTDDARIAMRRRETELLKALDLGDAFAAVDSIDAQGRFNR